MQFNYRTHTCGELRKENIGEEVILNGWVHSTRNLGSLLFVNLRDRYGIVQTVFEESENPDTYNEAAKLRSEFVVEIQGKVRARADEAVNNEMQTGEVEVVGRSVKILNVSETPPFVIKNDVDAYEDLRLKYRYLDLRRPEMRDNFVMRHKMYQSVRRYFDAHGFLEIETPMLMKSTPEGARDFLVPSRLHAGKFYALPQSPQTYKQLLMVAGFDKYFQIVKCFRDEDFRADRQPEFTQIDVEMSFVDQDNVFEVVEGLMKSLFKEIKGYELQTPIPRLSFNDAMEKYGSDKPDLRFEMTLTTLNDYVGGSDFRVFNDVLAKGGVVTAIVAKDCARYSRKQIDEITELAKKHGAGGLIWMKIKDGEVTSPVAKFLNPDILKNIVEQTGAVENDLILAIAGPKLPSLSAMGAVRLEIAKRENLIANDAEPKLLWVVDFPLFEWDDETQRFYAMHHPFTSPRPEDVPLLDSEPGKVRARAYDLVLNGSEIAGGSIRIHDSKMQAKMFKTLGISDEEAKLKFGFLIEAFKFGAPPHGGIAFGFDRMVTIFAGKDSIRDVIAFPKTTSGLSLMDEAPSSVDEIQLKELHIQLREKKEK